MGKLWDNGPSWEQAAPAGYCEQVWYLMGNSLSDQLLKAGLVDEDQVRKARKGKPKNQNKKQKRRNKQPVAEDPNVLRARKAAEEKARRDRELNQKQKERAERRARNAEIKQLIEANRVEQEAEADKVYHFTSDGRVCTIDVNEDLHKRLVAGKLALAKLNGLFEIVPIAVAEKIAARTPERVILPREESAQEDDPDYAEFKVPDDLMW